MMGPYHMYPVPCTLLVPARRIRRVNPNIYHMTRAATKRSKKKKEALRHFSKVTLKNRKKRDHYRHHHRPSPIAYLRRSMPQMSVTIPNHPLTRSAAFSNKIYRFVNASVLSKSPA